MLRIRLNLDPPPASGVFHAEAIDRSGVVITDLLLLGIEPDALADNGLVWLACCAPYGERHFKTDDQGAGGVEVAGAGTEGVFTGELVRRGETLLVGWDITGRGGVSSDQWRDGKCLRRTVPYLTGISNSLFILTRQRENLLKPCILNGGDGKVTK